MLARFPQTRNCYLLLAASLVGCVACSGLHSTERQIGISIASKPPDLIKQYYRDVDWRLPEPQYEYAYLLDRPTFLRKHRDELLQTLEVVETVESGNIGVGFVRYSLGAHIYREAVWLRKVDGSWRVASSQYFSSYGADPFADGKPDAAKALIKRVEEWKESSDRWW